MSPERSVPDVPGTHTIRWSMLLVLLLAKRWRHLVVLMMSILLVGWVTTTISLAISRARPVGIDILGYWHGFSHPSRPVAMLAVSLIGFAYAVVVPGRPRSVAKWVTGALLVAVGFARLYLGVDHPSDFVSAVIVGVTIPLVLFRTLTPNEVFPVSYRKGRTAHLDVGGERGHAIRKALEDQLGLSVETIEPFNLEGSGGSTPLRLGIGQGTSSRGNDEVLFAKLYAATHLRSDRWYKLGRTLLYGRLEDEQAFSSVRNLVQHEDYMLRLFRDAGIGVAEPYGVVEITPVVEYLIVTGFIEGADEMTEGDISDECIEHAFATIRMMWDAGLAHRDIKPSNVLVVDDRIWLVDVAFSEVRPSPWRQAVDLANMMLVLGLRSDAERVYRAALLYFSPDEIAESFAATHGVTMPSQLRSMLKSDGRNLVSQFRDLAPDRARISIQHWSWRRVLLWASVIAGALVVGGLGIGNLQGVGLL